MFLVFRHNSSRTLESAVCSGIPSPIHGGGFLGMELSGWSDSIQIPSSSCSGGKGEMAEEPYPQNGLSGKDWILPPPTGTPILEEYEKGGVKGGGAPEVVFGSPIIVDPGLVLSTNFGRTLTMDDVFTSGCPACTCDCPTRSCDCPTCSLVETTGGTRGVEPPIAPSTSE